MQTIPLLFTSTRRVAGTFRNLAVELAATGLDLNTLFHTVFARVLSTIWK